jgi:polar amino acid transport system ATP-binding protein
VTDTTPVLQAQGIWKSYGGVDVLKGVDISVADRECVFIIGPSGSGKSTFLRCLNRLEEPDAGVVRLNGAPVTGHRVDLNNVRRHIGMVFQSFNLYPHLTAIGNVTLALRRVLTVPKDQARADALKALELVGLSHKADAYPSMLSGGQQQRVAIARSVALRPKVMLFDEPTSALDPELVGGVIDVMRNLRADGMTMVVVTHELSFAREAGDRVLFMVDGAQVALGRPDEVLDRPAHPRLIEFLSRVS